MDPSAAAPLLARCLAEVMALEGVDLPACRQLRGRIDDGRFNLVVAGEFNRGKSSVANALLGAAVLPVAVVPLTSVVTSVRHGEAQRATVHFLGGGEREIAPAHLAAFVTERGNPGNAKSVECVDIAYPSPWLGAGIRLVDTPGIGSVHRHNSDITYRFLPQSDVVLFVASVDQPMGRAELDFLVDIRRDAAKVVCLLNKADQATADELCEAVAFAAAAVQDALGMPVPVIALSARQALAGQMQGDAALVQQSGLPELQRALRRLLGEDRHAIWLDSLSRALLRILSRARLGAGLESKGLSEPVAQLEAKLEVFGRKKREALQAMADDDILIEAEAKKLVKGTVEPDLERFKAVLQASLAASVERRFDELGGGRGKRLQDELEPGVVGAVRAAYDGWRRDEDAALARAFDALCERFRRHIEDIGDELLKQSAQLFALAYESARSTSAWHPRSQFRYKFWSEPTSLNLLGASLVAGLPNFIGAALIREGAKRRAADLVEIQAGRVRHDFEERLKASAQDLRSELRRAMESTVAGIESAIVGGSALRQRGEAEAAARHAVLTQTLTDIDALEARIREISG